MRPGCSVFYSNGVLSRSSRAQRPSHGRWSRGCLENDRMVSAATPTGLCCLMVSPARDTLMLFFFGGSTPTSNSRLREPRGGSNEVGQQFVNNFLTLFDLFYRTRYLRNSNPRARITFPISITADLRPELSRFRIIRVPR
ncbi:PREDICTED: uncharacterized protein LOC105458101 [Wasmannia auropunctata]|uniref:uncharacterized protein LOC105458101 n=1 Tax=Wasmannia auropunctata TaxID=64793 RepID=UPI0005EFC116|nr:PREDICTED: uncharacterized protein LOC105458101 [Wasmannia auropunctata]